MTREAVVFQFVIAVIAVLGLIGGLAGWSPWMGVIGVLAAAWVFPRWIERL